MKYALFGADFFCCSVPLLGYVDEPLQCLRRSPVSKQMFHYVGDGNCGTYCAAAYLLETLRRETEREREGGGGGGGDGSSVQFASVTLATRCPVS